MSSSEGVARRPVSALVGAWVALAVLLVACSNDKERPSAAGAYALVIGWFMDQRDPAVDSTIVYVAPQGEGFSVGLDMQASIISNTKDIADVRFVDDRAEALDAEGLPRDGALVLSLGAAVEDGSRLHIGVDEVLGEQRAKSWQFALRARGQDWRLTGTPETVPL